MSLAYFPLYPDDFEADTAHLSLAEDGAFNRLLRLCWRTPGCSVPADRAWVYRRMRAHTEADQAMVEMVISEFFREADGRLSNARLSKEWLAANEAHERRKSAGAKGGKSKALKTNETAPSNARPMLKQPEPEPEPEPLVDTDTDVSVADPAPDEADPQADDPPKAVSALEAHRIDTAFRMFVAAAERQPGWTVPKALNRQRRIALAGRIREHGLDGWGQVIERAERSRFLTGQGVGDRPFGLTLDWLCKPANLLKVLEGNYDDRTANPARTDTSRPAGPGGAGGRLDAFDRLAERLAGNAPRPDAGRHPDPGPADDGVIDARFTRLTG